MAQVLERRMVHRTAQSDPHSPLRLHPPPLPHPHTHISDNLPVHPTALHRRLLHNPSTLLSLTYFNLTPNLSTLYTRWSSAAEALTGKDVEARLRELELGYRAKYLWRTACIVANEREAGWLESLRISECPLTGISTRGAGDMAENGREGYRKAHEALLELAGVGPKVADYVCLKGLGWGEAVPVDTHVWQIAVRDYSFGKGRHSRLTKATYDAAGNKFRALWGKEAGWAYSVLFTADLKVFKKEEVVVKEKMEDGEDGAVVEKQRRRVVVKEEEDVVYKEKNEVIVKEETGSEGYPITPPQKKKK